MSPDSLGTLTLLGSEVDSASDKAGSKHLEELRMALGRERALEEKVQALQVRCVESE